MNFRLGMTILVAGTICLYFHLDHKLTGGFNFSTWSDAKIPLWPVWAVGLVWAALKMDDQLFTNYERVQSPLKPAFGKLVHFHDHASANLYC